MEIRHSVPAWKNKNSPTPTVVIECIVTVTPQYNIDVVQAKRCTKPREHVLPWWSVVFTWLVFVYMCSQSTQVSWNSVIKRDSVWLLHTFTKKRKTSTRQNNPESEMASSKQTTKALYIEIHMATDACIHACCANYGWHGRSLKSSREENPRGRWEGSLSMQTNFRFSCGQITT